MKGFLAGYKLMQGTANGLFVNFQMTPKNATFFTITISTDNNAFLSQIWYFRIGYDQTSIERQNFHDVFRDFYFNLTNNNNSQTIYTPGWTSLY
jgi:hypothetical protein